MQRVRALAVQDHDSWDGKQLECCLPNRGSIRITNLERPDATFRNDLGGVGQLVRALPLQDHDAWAGKQLERYQDCLGIDPANYYREARTLVLAPGLLRIDLDN